MKRFSLLVGALLTACANPINLKTAERYYVTGRDAEFSGDYATARERYARALLNARLGHADPATISMLTYNLGRMEGYIGKCDEAQKLLMDALAQEEQITGPESGITTMRLFELARLNYDQKNYQEAQGYYKRGIPAGEKLGVTESDPIGLANAIDEYADALEKGGEHPAASEARQKAQVLRTANPSRKADFVPERYKCAK